MTRPAIAGHRGRLDLPVPRRRTVINPSSSCFTSASTGMPASGHEDRRSQLTRLNAPSTACPLYSALLVAITIPAGLTRLGHVPSVASTGSGYRPGGPPTSRTAVASSRAPSASASSGGPGRPMRYPRRGAGRSGHRGAARPSSLRLPRRAGGGSHRRHGKQYGYRTSGHGAPMPAGARMAGSGRGAVRTGRSVYGGHQPEPSVRTRHGVLAAELAAYAAAGRSPPAADGHEGREGQRRGDRRARGGHYHRRHQGRGVKEVAHGHGEHQPCDEHDGRQPTRRAGITDHRQPLFACLPSRVAVRRCRPIPASLSWKEKSRPSVDRM